MGSKAVYYFGIEIDEADQITKLIANSAKYKASRKFSAAIIDVEKRIYFSKIKRD